MSQHSPISRRDVLKLSASGAICASLANWLPGTVRAAQSASSATRSVIVLWMTGGASQLDTFDMKPGHDNGGPFRPIETSAPGVRICEHLPAMARLMNHCVPIRSMSTPAGDHLQSTRHMRSAGSPVPLRARTPANRQMPAYVAIAPYIRFNPVGGGSGFLGSQVTPFVLNEANQTGLRPNSDFGSNDSTNVRTSPELAHALNLESEGASVRDAYGRNPFGQGCLQARRLVERGVPIVEVSMNDAGNRQAFAWDTHTDSFSSTKNLLQTLDSAWSTLIIDLKDRGLLDSTLIVWMSEFGRTPVINAQSGRDHFSNAWTTVLCGGGLPGGQVIGRTSRDGMSVEDRPVSAADLHTMIGNHLSSSAGKSA